LIVSLDALLRMSSNPFFSYMAQRIEEHLPARPDGDAIEGGAPVQAPPQAAPPPRRLPSAAPDTPAAASSDRPAKKRSHR
ncbi:MAG: alpha/beta hydrolase, partial [Methylocystis sp.]|nr:alpha/beta hydrolase [Methylocystis sp.]